MSGRHLLFSAVLLSASCAAPVEDGNHELRDGLTPDDCDPASNPNKQRVCHDKNNGHVLIEVSVNAADKHLDPQTGHDGDALPGDAGLNCVCEPLTAANLCDGAVAGTECSDEDACTAGDVCDGSGSCVPGTPLVCDTAQGQLDGVITQCQQYTGTCSPDSGCEIVDLVDGTACDDGDEATCDDACSAGVCVGDAAACVDPCETIVFADAAIDARVRLNLGIAAGDPITNLDVIGYTSLSVPNSGVSDLTGVECLADVQVLNFENNDITDLTPLSSLDNVLQLFLTGNSNLTDLDGVQDLPLTRINVSGTSVTDLTPLDGNATIKNFGAASTGLSDISALTTMPLESVAIQNNAITNISALGNKPNLSIVILEVNDIADISPLATTPNVTQLFLAQNVNLSDISAVDGMPLTLLSIGKTSVTDISPLENNTTMTRFIAPSTGLSDISALAGMPLTGVGLQANNISDISALGNKPDLTYIDLEENAVTDISPLFTSPNVESLFLRDNSGLSDIGAVDGMPLTILTVNATSVTDLSPLQNNTTMVQLNVSVTGLSDLSPLANVPLAILVARRNNISDLSVISDLTTLTYLDVAENAISNTAPLSTACHLDTLLIDDNTYTCPDATLTSLDACVTTLVSDCP